MSGKWDRLGGVVTKVEVEEEVEVHQVELGLIVTASSGV